MVFLAGAGKQAAIYGGKAVLFHHSIRVMFYRLLTTYYCASALKAVIKQQRFFLRKKSWNDMLWKAVLNLAAK